MGVESDRKSDWNSWEVWGCFKKISFWDFEIFGKIQTQTNKRRRWSLLIPYNIAFLFYSLFLFLQEEPHITCNLIQCSIFFRYSRILLRLAHDIGLSYSNVGVIMIRKKDYHFKVNSNNLLTGVWPLEWFIIKIWWFHMIQYFIFVISDTTRAMCAVTFLESSKF